MLDLDVYFMLDHIVGGGTPYLTRGWHVRLGLDNIEIRLI